MKTVFIVANEEDKELMVKLGKSLKDFKEADNVYYTIYDLDGYSDKDIKNINAMRMTEYSDEVIFISKLPNYEDNPSPFVLGIEFNNIYLWALAKERLMKIRTVYIGEIK